MPIIPAMLLYLFIYFFFDFFFFLIFFDFFVIKANYFAKLANLDESVREKKKKTIESDIFF